MEVPRHFKGKECDFLVVPHHVIHHAEGESSLTDGWSGTYDHILFIGKTTIGVFIKNIESCFDSVHIRPASFLKYFSRTGHSLDDLFPEYKEENDDRKYNQKGGRHLEVYSCRGSCIESYEA